MRKDKLPIGFKWRIGLIIKKIIKNLHRHKWQFSHITESTGYSSTAFDKLDIGYFCTAYFVCECGKYKTTKLEGGEG